MESKTRHHARSGTDPDQAWSQIRQAEREPHLSEADSDMETTEAVEWSLSQLRMGDDNAALRAPSPAAGPAPKEHVSTSEFACARHGTPSHRCRW